ncbi:PREDICTED: protein LCHN-like [Priapulus caudatus]|uniref:DENN domain-containing protein 11 n=1 Tax=Priapulus caudatus TaxID=37621 RepID=A0ABM1F8K5_PRICU|nr:PREDICTED: protein LCHN-like [Priapulus caudatus]
MVSGGHRLHSDFLYFKKDNLYGISCFENMPVESQLERGARMKSVGILTTSYRNLHCHKPFLEIQVRKLLEDPGNYDILEDFYEKKKGVLHEQSDNSSSTYLTADSTRSYPSATDGHSHLKNLHPAGCFLQFVQFFRERIFILWKFALLRKRILFYSSPPIGAVCYRVYCAMCLVEHGIAGLSESLVPIQPLFYVNVADIESIEEEISYIACTTEKIFETKTRLFDVYIDKEKLLTHSPTLKNINHVNSSDRNKFKKLNKISVGTSKKTEDDSFDDEDTFIVFFRELNERLFRTLLEASASHDRRLTANHMRSIGLHPRADRDFISRVAETYNIDVVLATEHPCCPLLFD